MKKRSIAGVLFSVFFLAAPAQAAANLDVCPTGCTYTTIQAAIDVAADGDLIRVAQGRYCERLKLSRALEVEIQGGWDAGFTTRSTDPTLTVIDALGLDRVLDLSLADGRRMDLALSSFTFTGGEAGSGGGISAYASTGRGATANTFLSLTLSNNIIQNNQAYSSNGGGIYAYAYTDGAGSFRSEINLYLQDNQILKNRASDSGGGIFFSAYANPAGGSQSLLRLRLASNRISGNSAEDAAGARIIATSSLVQGPPIEFRVPMLVNSALISNNEISGNRASDDYGGLYIDLGSGSSGIWELENNLIAGNGDHDGRGGLFLYSSSSSNSFDLINNTISRNDGKGLTVESWGVTGDPDSLNIDLINNVVSGNSPSSGVTEISFSKSGTSTLAVNSSCNVLGSLALSGVTITDGGGNTATADPKLGDDFYPLAGSPALDSANPGEAPSSDKDANPRVGPPDRGALERQGRDHQARQSPPGSFVLHDYPPTVSPLVTSNPLSARPLSVGDFGAGTLNLSVKLPEFSSAVDVYVSLYVPFLDSVNLYQFPTLATLAAAGPLKWKSAVSSPISESLTGDIPLSALSAAKGKWHAFLEVTPANTPGMAVYRYETHFLIQ